ncbi:MAG TPA: SteA domain-containing protein, partial [Pseudonocardia sp.]
LVDGKAVAALYRSPVSAGAVLVLVGAVLLATLTALLVSDAGPALLGYLERGVSWSMQLVKGWL